MHQESSRLLVGDHEIILVRGLFYKYAPSKKKGGQSLISFTLPTSTEAYKYVGLDPKTPSNSSTEKQHGTDKL